MTVIEHAEARAKNKKAWLSGLECQACQISRHHSPLKKVAHLTVRKDKNG
jgi:hypothetical protein